MRKLISLKEYDEIHNTHFQNAVDILLIIGALILAMVIIGYMVWGMR